MKSQSRRASGETETTELDGTGAVGPRRWRWVVGGLVVAALVGVVGAAFSRGRGRAEYEAQLAAIRAAGEPLTAEDFAVLCPDPAPERDFRVLLRSCLPPGSPPGTDVQLDDGRVWQEMLGWTNRQAYPEGLAEKIRGVVGSNAGPVEVLLRTDLTGFRYRAGWTNGWYSQVNSGGANQEVGEPTFQRIAVAHALALQTVHEVEGGRGGAAVTALVRGLQVARIPTSLGLAGGVGRLAALAITLRPVERVLNRVALEEVDLARLQAALSVPDDIVREMMIGERAFQVYVWGHFASLGVMGSTGAGVVVEGVATRVGGMLRGHGGRLRMLARWNRLVEASRGRVREQIEAGRRHREECQRQQQPATAWVARAAQRLSMDHRLLFLLEPKITAALEEHAILMASTANARVAVAIERWRLAHGGALPEGLDGLVPRYLESPVVDPFDGQSVRYRRLPGGYVVYCLGLDGEDNGGREGDRGAAPGCDTTLVVERGSGTR